MMPTTHFPAIAFTTSMRGSTSSRSRSSKLAGGLIAYGSSISRMVLQGEGPKPPSVNSTGSCAELRRSAGSA